MTSKESARAKADKMAAAILAAVHEARENREDYESAHSFEDIALHGLAFLLVSYPDYDNLQAVAQEVTGWLDECDDDPRWYA